SENSEYDDAKNEQGRLESEISELEAKLRNSDIIHAAANTGKVMIGSTVIVRDVEFDEEETYMIVGSTEADPDKNKISDESPLGSALLNNRAGAKVKIHAPAGIIEFEILEVK
ncbi:MAG: transcription elongation factor GreA, partial [Selenomonadaceae bacterium]|nr:transcription elongation factor GreA [Selenomonadaceae bacterium]